MGVLRHTRRGCPFVNSGPKWGCDLPVKLHSQKVTTRRKRLSELFRLFDPSLQWKFPTNFERSHVIIGEKEKNTTLSCRRRIKNMGQVRFLWGSASGNTSKDFTSFSLEISVLENLSRVQRSSRSEYCVACRIIFSRNVSGYSHFISRFFEQFKIDFSFKRRALIIENLRIFRKNHTNRCKR